LAEVRVNLNNDFFISRFQKTILCNFFSPNTYHMRMQKIILPLFLLLLVSSSIYAQTPETILDSVNAGRKPEKLFTHFDKPFYQPGEIIWFKTYITVDGRPGTLSTVVKAELLNEAGKLIASQVLPVTIGSVPGSLQLPPDLAYGIYIFRLYTQHMINTGSVNLHYKPIQVLPPDFNFPKITPVTDITLRFFPESGTLLNDELNVMAFTATDQLGRPAVVSGMIKDSHGKDVTAFSTEYNGMGKIELTPQKGEQYIAHYTYPSVDARAVELPAASDEGTTLLILDELVKKRLVVSSRFSQDTRLKPAYVLGEMDQTLIFKIDISKSNGHYMARVPTQDLPGGLLHVAVFNAEHKVLAERTCFVNSRKDTAAALLIPVVTNLMKREENRFDFMLPDSLEGTFSISVTDLAASPVTANSDNIIAATLLTSNLRGIAYYPFYNSGQLTGDIKNDAADLLLLTHDYLWGWQQLEKLSMTKPFSSGENYIPLRGRAYADRNKKPLPGSELLFFIQTKDSSVNSFAAKTNDQGYFEVPGLFYEDTATIYVRNNSEKNKDKKVDLEMLSPTLSEKYEAPGKNNMAIPPLPLFWKEYKQLATKKPGPLQPAIDFDTTGNVLQELVVVSKTKSPTQQLEKRYVKGLFAGSTRSTIDFINDKPSYLGGNIFDYLKGRYSYMQVTGNFPNYALIYRQMRSLGTGTPLYMALYLDEMQVDAATLTTIPMTDIAMVRIYTTGIVGSAGAVAVYTKKGEDAASSSTYSYMSKFLWPGFSKVSSFYSPDYKKLNDAAIKNDNRKTLYWNSSLTYIPEDGKVPVSFYNTDQCKEYKIVLQGFTTDGRLVYMEKVIQ
jgi:hypothetical protein